MEVSIEVYFAFLWLIIVSILYMLIMHLIILYYKLLYQIFDTNNFVVVFVLLFLLFSKYEYFYCTYYLILQK